MVDLSNLQMICAEREAQMTDEERAERDRKHEEQLRKMHERMFAPIWAMEPTLRILEEQERMERLVRPLGHLQDLIDDPVTRLNRDLAAESAMEQAVRDVIDDPVARALRDAVDDPVARMAREIGASPMVDERLMGSRFSGFGSTECSRPLFDMPPPPPNYQARIAEGVTEVKHEVREVKREVRDANTSASRGAHRRRLQVIRRDRREAGFKLWHVILAAVVTTLVTVPLTVWLTTLLGG